MSHALPLPEPSAPPRRVISRNDDEWPSMLNELGPAQPVQTLHVSGRPLPDGNKLVGVVGTRRPTAAGIEAAERLTRGLVEGGFGVVSGLALGIDTVAHRVAVRCGGYTAAVLGCGLDVDYPKGNRRLRAQILETGTMVSEYGPTFQPAPYTFPQRNRIIAGLCKAVVVIEGRSKSGALITARHALDANRMVFAVPGSMRNAVAEGPNELIRTGRAALVTNVAHIFEELAPGIVWGEKDSPSVERPSITDAERSVLEVLDDAPVPPDRICALTKREPGEVALALARLEVRNFVIRRRSGYEIGTAGARAREALFSS